MGFSVSRRRLRCPFRGGAKLGLPPALTATESVAPSRGEDMPNEPSVTESGRRRGYIPTWSTDGTEMLGRDTVYYSTREPAGGSTSPSTTRTAPAGYRVTVADGGPACPLHDLPIPSRYWNKLASWSNPTGRSWSIPASTHASRARYSARWRFRSRSQTRSLRPPSRALSRHVDHEVRQRPVRRAGRETGELSRGIGPITAVSCPLRKGEVAGEEDDPGAGEDLAEVGAVGGAGGRGDGGPAG